MKRDLWYAVAALLVVATAALSLHRVFATAEWRPDAAVALVLAVTLAAIFRLLRLPAAASAALSAVTAVWFATVMYVPEAGPLPGWSALQDLRELIGDGIVETRLQPAPTEPLESLRLLVVFGVWGVGHVTHDALVRLRRPGLALLPPILLWLVPLAVPQAPGPTWPHTVPFLLAAAVVLLLEPNLDLVGWTREDDRPRLPRLGLASAGVAVVVAVLVPGILPGYGGEPWLDVTTPTEPRGYQPIVDVGDRLQLPRPRDVMLVTANRPLYLRLAALETFDGRTWRLGPPGEATYRPDPTELFRTDGALPFEATITTGDRVEASVRILDLENIYVPVPYQVDRISGPDDAGLFYSREGGFVATGDLTDNELLGRTRIGVTPGFEYEFESVVPTPDYASLAALGTVSAPDPGWTQLPEAYEDLKAEAEAVYAAAGAETTIDRVLALQDYFIADGSPFVYSTDVPTLRGDDALRQFVFETQTGYCEYYATAMAVMLRATGIPVRVAVGFLPGRVLEPAMIEGADATFIVSTTDAHAWVEVFFPEHGWVKFDPTPRGDGSTLPPTEDDLDPIRSVMIDRADATPSPSDTPDIPRPTDRPSVAPTATSSTGAQDGSGVPVWLWLVAAGAVTATAGFVASRRRPVELEPVAAVLSMQRRVLRTAARLGVGRRPSETLSEVTARWVRDGRVHGDDAITFARLASEAAFGDRAPEDAASVAMDLERRLIDQLRASVPARQRVTAPAADTAHRASAWLRERQRTRTGG